ncbi:uncharacterized protein LOC130742393 [Lotus japonicus]|uniref:uncharacterized protein LOC130742393 n=1 Tax=Lotus japonicus TaxID=34305 RepID=UPI002586E2DB|nr:uncharacterized protein LOC130742393 [Lotus japonicus]
MPNNTGQRRYFSHCLPPRRKPKTVDPLFSYIAVAEKQGSFLQTILSSACTAAKGEGKESACRRRKIGRSCRRALMAALNHTSLGKKIVKSRKIKKDTAFSKSRIGKLEEGDRISNIEQKTTTPAFTVYSSSSSTCLSSSQGTLALVSFPMNGFGVKKQKQLDVRDSRKGYFGSTTAMCLLLLTSLLVLILWGKFCAILCTSIGFFVVPHLGRKYMIK